MIWYSAELLRQHQGVRHELAIRVSSLIAAEVYDKEMAAAVSQIAELALLGAGHVQTMFPETLDEAYESFGGDELQWRVVL